MDQDIEKNDDQQKIMDKIYRYYAENTKANHLDEVLGHEDFSIKLMDHTHHSWIHDDAQVIEICNEFGESLSNSSRVSEIIEKL